MSELYKFDKIIKDKYKILVGVDEVGRGPLAGPVVAVASIINEDISGINDSKKISEKKREKIYNEIIDTVEYGVGIVNENIIDDINILNATFLAMNMAIDELCNKYSLNKKDIYVIVDGDKIIRKYEGLQECIIKGDSKSLSIATSSIIAKVIRDRMMILEDEKYPEYDFKNNKGYGTKKHRDALIKHGATPIHRKTFIRKIGSDIYDKSGELS